MEARRNGSQHIRKSGRNSSDLESEVSQMIADVPPGTPFSASQGSDKVMLSALVARLSVTESLKAGYLALIALAIRR